MSLHDFEWSVGEVKTALDAGDVSLVDCRRAPELEMAKIDGTTWIPMEETPMRLAEFRALPQPIVIHCHHGVRSLRVATFLRDQGILAFSMAGGIEAWSLKVDAKVPRY